MKTECLAFYGSQSKHLSRRTQTPQQLSSPLKPRSDSCPTLKVRCLCLKSMAFGQPCVSTRCSQAICSTLSQQWAGFTQKVERQRARGTVMHTLLRHVRRLSHKLVCGHTHEIQGAGGNELLGVDRVDCPPRVTPLPPAPHCIGLQLAYLRPLAFRTAAL